MDSNELKAVRSKRNQLFTRLLNTPDGKSFLEELDSYVGSRVIRKSKDGRVDQVAMVYQGGMMDLLTLIKDCIDD